MKTTSFFFALSFAVFAVTVPSCFSADQMYEECLLPLRCGPDPMLLPNVTYPFWGVDKPKFCGLTEFQLFCTNGQFLTLEVGNVSLRVNSFDLKNQTITVVEENLFLGGCPDLTVNFTGSGQFTLDPLGESIDLFTCPASPLIAEPSSFTCEGINKSSVIYYTFRPSDTFGNGECTKVGAVPVLSSVYRDFVQRRLRLQDALENGFSLSYTIKGSESCQQCLTSRGICGSTSDSESFRCLCADKPHKSTCYENAGSINWRLKIFIGVTAAVLGIALMIIALILHNAKTSCVRDPKLEALIPLKRYSYAQVKKITKSFTHEVGKGGFGIVYRGILRDGRKVAVKVLKDSRHNNGEDFINEVASMSKTSHVNIVTLLGFCFEGSRRAIIYEFFENGSLDKFISFKGSPDIDWNAQFD